MELMSTFGSAIFVSLKFYVKSLIKRTFDGTVIVPANFCFCLISSGFRVTKELSSIGASLVDRESLHTMVEVENDDRSLECEFFGGCQQ